MALHLPLWASRAAVWRLLLAALVAGWARPSMAQPLQADPRARAEIERFASAWQRLRTATYRMQKRERLRGGKVVSETLLVKLRRPGEQVYMKRLKPREGQEVLYDPTRDRRRLVAHPGRFPDLTLRLDIEGGLATRDQHHVVSDSGYQQVLDVLRASLKQAESEPDGAQLRYLGTRKVLGRPAVGIELESGTAEGRRVSAREDESLFAFARRVGMDPYVIYVANPAIDDLDDELEEGEPYRVPAYYAARARIWFDQATAMPLMVTMWDREGREYEHYEHHDLRVDGPLEDLDFSTENPAYDF